LPEGKATFSFYAKGTNPAGGSYTVRLDRVSRVSPYESYTGPLTSTVTLTSSWQRFVYTFDVPSFSGLGTIDNTSHLYISIHQPDGDTSTAAWELNLTGVQLELGSTATPFEHRSYGDELAACQRYYYKIGGSVVYQRYFVASCQGPNFANGTVSFPVQMRSQPSIEHTGTAANYAIYTADAIAPCDAVPAIGTTGSDENVVNVSMRSTSGLVSGRAAEIISNNNANAYLAFSAEM
jgi:hypothetical protein